MKQLLLAGTLLAGLTLGASTGAMAATFTSDHCSGPGGATTGGCGPQANGFATIEGVQGTDGVTITISPLNGNGLINAGQTTFTFNLVGNPTITYSNLPTGFTVVGGTGTGGLTQNASVIHQDGFGNFEYGIDYTGANGANNPLLTPITFTVSDGVGFGLGNFAELSTGGDVAAFFALDIISATTGRTGLVDCCVGQPTPFSAVPGPIVGAGLPGLVTACIGLVFMGRRRRQRAA